MLNVYYSTLNVLPLPVVSTPLSCRGAGGESVPFRLRPSLSLKPIGKEEELVFDGIEPIGPVVGTGARVELVRNLLLKEFRVHIAIHFVEEVLGAAIEDDVHGTGFEQVGEVDDGVLVPKLGILLIGAQTTGYVPVLGEWTEVQSA